jgi:hypothetical protein
MRVATLTVLACALLLSGCPRPAAPGAAGGGGWVPGQGLPPEWPIKELTVPAGGKVFEGHVDAGTDGGRDVTVFYASSAGWESQVAAVEGQLKGLDYRRMPAGKPEDGGGQNRTWCDPRGALVVFLSYTEDPEGAQRIGQPGYYTLLVKQLKTALTVDPAWAVLK